MGALVIPAIEKQRQTGGSQGLAGQPTYPGLLGEL